MKVKLILLLPPLFVFCSQVLGETKMMADDFLICTPYKGDDASALTIKYNHITTSKEGGKSLQMIRFLDEGPDFIRREAWVRDGEEWINRCKKDPDSDDFYEFLCARRGELSFFNGRIMVYHKTKYFCDQVEQLK